ncbi:hypothetical protein IWQ61_010530, partial [Dispira simplex]
MATVKSSSTIFRPSNCGGHIQYGTTLEYDELDDQRIEHTVETKIQPEVSDLVSSVVGFKELGKYGNVANAVEELIRPTKESLSDDRQRRLCETVNKWFG